MSKSLEEELNFDGNLTEFLKTTSFLGFDPKHTRSLVEKKNVPLSTIAKAISFGLNRGTNLKSILVKTSEAGKAEIQKVMNAIGIVSTGDEKADESGRINKIDKDTITLPRLMAAFPVLTCTVNMDPNVRKLPITTELPVPFQWFGAGSVIPLKHSDMALWEEWYRKADQLINANKDILNDPRQYIESVKNSSILTAEERNKYHKALRHKSVQSLSH